MLTLFLRGIFLIFFLIIVSQGIFYLLALNKALSGISIDAYAEVRNATDQAIEWRLKFLYPAALLIGFVTTLSLIKTPDSLVFITTAIALACLAVDLFLAINFNVPINEQFQSYSADIQGIVDWQSMRRRWLQFLEYRGLVQVVGFLSLLLSWVKG